MKKYLLLVIVALLFSSCVKEDTHKIALIPEASGIDYCTDSDTLVVANDEGSYYEIDRDGHILNHEKLGKYDLEGVVCEKDRFLFAVEDEGILTMNRKSKETKFYTIKEKYQGNKIKIFDKNSGIEGIAKIGDSFYIAKQSKKNKESFIAQIMLEQDYFKITDIINHNVADTAGLTLHDGYLYLVSDKKNLLIKYDLKADKILKEIILPEYAQEGIAFDKQGYLYIADDNGAIYKYNKEELGL